MAQKPIRFRDYEMKSACKKRPKKNTTVKPPNAPSLLSVFPEKKRVELVTEQSAPLAKKGVFKTMLGKEQPASGCSEQLIDTSLPVIPHPEQPPRELLSSHQWLITNAADEWMESDSEGSDSEASEYFYPPHPMEREHTYSSMEVVQVTHRTLVSPFCYSSEGMEAELAEREQATPKSTNKAVLAAPQGFHSQIQQATGEITTVLQIYLKLNEHTKKLLGGQINGLVAGGGLSETAELRPASSTVASEPRTAPAKTRRERGTKPAQKKSPSKQLAKKYPCLIQGCESQPTAKDNLWDHLINHTDIRFINGNAKSLHQIGEVLLGQQGLIQCCVAGCQTEPFKGLEALGNHLKEQHSEELDSQPFNEIWKQKLVVLGYKVAQEYAGMSDQAIYEHLDNKSYLYLSKMNGLFLGKKYQTRHGKGMFCPACQQAQKEVKVNPTPEGVGKHWHEEHSTDRYECKVGACGQAEPAVSFNYYRRFLEHLMEKHDSLTVDELKASIIREDKTEEEITMPQTPAEAE